MKNVNDTMTEDLVNKWCYTNKGCGTIHYLNFNMCKDIIVNVLSKMFVKNPNLKVIIIVDSYEVRQEINNYIKDNNLSFDKITILTEKYINPKYMYIYDISIFVNINDYSDAVRGVSETCKYILFMIGNDIISTDKLNNIYKHFPAVNNNFSSEDIVKVNLSSPVEEVRIACYFDNADNEQLYKEYTDYITQCMVIFETFDNINKARVGDNEHGLSATDVRNWLANKNGWSDDLDMSIPFNKQIDECYNPNILLDKANTCYRIIRSRNNLVTDCNAKLPIILDIVKNNNDKKILIISKRGEFAAKITSYLADNGIGVGDYHDCIEPKVLLDDNGVPVLYKSGSMKGQPRIIKSKAISSLNERLFNNDDISVLSIKNSSSDELKIAVDLVIITSPICDNVDELKYRFRGVIFNTIPNIIYKVYMSDTIEETKMLSQKISKFVSITTINNNDENFDGIVCE